MNLNRPACCVPKSLPDHLQVAAAFDSMIVRASNVPPVIVEMAHEDIPLSPLRIAMSRGRYWRPSQVLRVAFLGGSSDINGRVLAHANAWATPGVPVPSFVGVSRGSDCDILVGYDQPGYWSFIGTDSRMLVGQGQRSLNLQGFDSTEQPESEWKRVVRHEFGHALGALHEQQRPDIVKLLDPEKVYAWAAATQGWSREVAYDQMLRPLDMSKVDATAVDKRSVMEYWFSSDLTVDGQPIPGGDDIDDYDRQGMALVYGGSVVTPPVPPVNPPPHPPAGLPLLTIDGPAHRGRTPLKVAVETATPIRLDLQVELLSAAGRAPVVTVASAGEGEKTPIRLRLTRAPSGTAAFPWRRTDPWPGPGSFVLSLAHPAGKVGATVMVRLRTVE